MSFFVDNQFDWGNTKRNFAIPEPDKKTKFQYAYPSVVEGDEALVILKQILLTMAPQHIQACVEEILK